MSDSLRDVIDMSQFEEQENKKSLKCIFKKEKIKKEFSVESFSINQDLKHDNVYLNNITFCIGENDLSCFFVNIKENTLQLNYDKQKIAKLRFNQDIIIKCEKRLDDYLIEVLRKC